MSTANHDASLSRSGSDEVHSTTSPTKPNIDRLIHVPVPDKPKYTKRKPEGLSVGTTAGTTPPRGAVVAAVGGDASPGLTPASSSPADVPQPVGTTSVASPSTTSPAGQMKGEIDAYSPTHFQNGILSPVYTGGAEVVYDPSNVPLPQAAKRLAVDAALRDRPVMQPPAGATRVDNGAEQQQGSTGSAELSSMLE